MPFRCKKKAPAKAGVKKSIMQFRGRTN